MGISEKKMQIVINNYFEQECDVNTSIREAFEKGFKIGVKKGISAQPQRMRGEWIDVTKTGGAELWKCSECGGLNLEDTYFCPNCGAKMEG